MNEFLENIKTNDELAVITESVSIHNDPEDGVLVRHVYRTNLDGRRTTAFYPMGSNDRAVIAAQVIASVIADTIEG